MSILKAAAASAMISRSGDDPKKKKNGQPTVAGISNRAVSSDDAPSGMSNRQKKDWADQQNKLQAERDSRQELKDNPVKQDIENQKRHKEALERGVSHKYYKGSVNKGSKDNRTTWRQSKRFEAGCGAAGGSKCEER